MVGTEPISGIGCRAKTERNASVSTSYLTYKGSEISKPYQREIQHKIKVKLSKSLNNSSIYRNN
jgi:hypothetical protein